ncbi:DUF1501 domain-containing protein [Enterovibrio sp. ZSDZ35]|uniref:DUF1501 domain-containing protein n=1 Tax=Enterovibrio qingdaonensis TaxID=2899818 RepID=A0ABT5QTR2_9GAMM|nr:DUF1501 domain-containing protein [Enterovibrio sp. ZSDZ35]MDD1783676.1 DUF1501 domain-containing protein [Enterovibrio sp. ZSDZ35]
MTLSRRQFMTAMGATSTAALVPASFSAYASEAEDYRALVCVFLKGGNDFFHQVVPLNTEHHQDYANSRQKLAVPKARLLKTGMRDSQGIALGLHQSLKPLLPLFQQGKASLVLNVGPMIAPITPLDIESGKALLPPNLFAHNKQQEAWQHSWLGETYSKAGWLGMTADVLMDEMGGMPSSFFTGANSLLDGHSNRTMYVNKNGFQSLKGLTSPAMRHTYQAIAGASYTSPLAKSYANVVAEAITAQKQMAKVVSSYPLDNRIPKSNLGRQFRAIKQMMDAAPMFGHNRQVFYLAVGGYDTHDNQISRQDKLMKEFSEAVAGFYHALEEDGTADHVMTGTLSEFGRTLHDNSRKGTDHGWGGGQFIFGGGLRGKCIGEYPAFKRNGPDDNGDGRLIPKISHEQYAAYMVKWLGLSEQGVNTIFPRLSQFGGLV